MSSLTEEAIQIDSLDRSIYSPPKTFKQAAQKPHRHAGKCAICQKDFNSKGRFKICLNCHAKGITKHSNVKNESKSVLTACNQCNKKPEHMVEPPGMHN